MKWAKLAIVATVTSCALAVSAMSAQAATNSQDESIRGSAASLLDIAGLTSSTAEMRPATAAEQRQMTIDSVRDFYPDATDEEALLYMSNSELTSRLAYKVQDLYGDSYAYFRVDPGKRFGATMYLKGAPTAALKLIEAAQIPGLRIDNNSFLSENEKLALVTEARRAAANSGLIRAVSTTYDIDKRSITVEIEPKPGIAFDAVARLVPTTVTAPSTTGKSPVTVAVTTVPSDGGLEPAAVFSGGTALSWNQNTAGDPARLACTAAFGVQKQVGSDQGRLGLLSAEHCPTTMWYEGNIKLAAAAQTDTSVWADARFFYNMGTNSRRDFIYARSSSGAILTKPALATGTIGVDEMVCNYGSTTADQSVGRQKCAYVGSLGNPFDYCYDDGRCFNWANQTRTKTRITDPGDSGGPWFVNNTAIGVMSAHDRSGIRQWSSFQPIRDATRKTGTAVIVAG